MVGREGGERAVDAQEVAEGDAVGAGDRGRRQRVRGVEVGEPAVLDADAVGGAEFGADEGG